MKRALAAAAYLGALAYSCFRHRVREMPHDTSDCWSACTHSSHWRRHIPSPADAWDRS